MNFLANNISGDTDFLLTINYCMNMCGRQKLKKKKNRNSRI